MPSTALQMVNRVLGNLSQNPVSGFSDENRSNLALSHINQAARSLFEEGTWDWLVRHDGILRLYPRISGVGANLPISNVTYASGSVFAQFRVTDNDEEDIRKSSVGSYIVLESDTKWENTAFKILGTFDTGGARAMRLETQWHSEPVYAVTDTYSVVFPEYVLPATVQTIESVRHQDQEVTIVLMDPEESFDRRFPNAHEDDGDPEVIAIGGLGTETIADTSGAAEGTAATPGLRAWVWPIPDDDYILNYSYRVKPAALSATTDTFAGVPESAIDRIVDDATMEMMLTVPTSDAELGQINSRMNDRKRARLMSHHRPDKGRRFSLKSLDRVGRGRRDVEHRQTFGSLDLDG